MPSTHSKDGGGVVVLSLRADNSITDISWNLNLDNSMEELMMEVCSD